MYFYCSYAFTRFHNVQKIVRLVILHSLAQFLLRANNKATLRSRTLLLRFLSHSHNVFIEIGGQNPHRSFFIPFFTSSTSSTKWSYLRSSSLLPTTTTAATTALLPPPHSSLPTTREDSYPTICFSSNCWPSCHVSVSHCIHPFWSLSLSGLTITWLCFVFVVYVMYRSFPSK